MREDVDDAVRLEFEHAAAIRHDVVLVLAAPHRHAAAAHLEQIDGGNGVEREHARVDDRRQPGRRRTALEKHVEGRRIDLRTAACAGPCSLKPRNLFGNAKKSRSNSKPEKNAVVALEQGFVLAKADLLQHLQRRRDEFRVAQRVEIADGDLLAVGEELLVDGATQSLIEPSMWIGSVSTLTSLTAAGRLRRGRLFAAARRQPPEAEPQSGHRHPAPPPGPASAAAPALQNTRPSRG